MNLWNSRSQKGIALGEYMLRVGILMIQGGRSEHMEAMMAAAEQLGLEVEMKPIRKSTDLEAIDGIIFPGGESTSMKIAAQNEGLLEDVYSFIRQTKIPVLSTCAGTILLCQNNFLNATISRNAFGRQIDSFSSPLRVLLSNDSIKPVKPQSLGKDYFGYQPLPMWPEAPPESNEFLGIFIRAPRFDECKAEAVVYLNDEIVGVRDGNRLGLTFHPELTQDRRFHRWLIREMEATS